MSGAAAPAAPAAAPPTVPIDADAVEIIDKCELRTLMPAVASIEMTKKIDKQMLYSIGMGAPEGIIFFDLHTAEEKKKWIGTYSTHLVAADKKAYIAFGRDRGFTDRRERIMCMCRALRGLLDALTAERLPSAATNNKITVVQGDAEDNAYSKEFDGTWLEQQVHMAWVMYKRSFVAGILPKHTVLKKIFYAISVEHRMASIARVPIKSLRTDPLDSAMLILKRYLVGHFLCGVGASALPSMDAIMYGDMGHEFPVQYISWHDCQDLLDTCEVEFAGLDDAVALAIVETVITNMVAKSSTGHPRLTASAAIGKTVHEINQITGTAKISTRAVQVAMLEQGRGGEPPAKKPKPGEGEPALGPNLLERKKGGNDAGALCIDFAKGKCPRNKCSFKHAKADAAEEE